MCLSVISELALHLFHLYLTVFLWPWPRSSCCKLLWSLCSLTTWSKPMAIKLTNDNPTNALLIPHFVVLQPYSKMDSIHFFNTACWQPDKKTENSHVHKWFCTFGSNCKSCWVWCPKRVTPVCGLCGPFLCSTSPAPSGRMGSVGQGHGPLTSRLCAQGHCPAERRTVPSS